MPQRHLKNRLQLQRLTLAVGGALAQLAPAHAQVFDVNSAAVRQAYVGATTHEKKDAALAGLGIAVNQIQQLITYGSLNTGFRFFQSGSASSILLGSDLNLTVGLSRYLVVGGDVNDAFKLKTISPTPPVITTIQAARDSDLGAPGSTVLLNSNILRTLDSFSTARNFTVGNDGATIDTNGFNFGISGNVTANGTLVKDGLGTLALTGNNTWLQQPKVANGVLEGNTTSLQTSIINNGTVRFNQSSDSTYNGNITTSTFGNLEKSGAGKLTLTGNNAYGGTTSILGGTLALSGTGTLGNTSGLNISNGTGFDISNAQIVTHGVGLLSGSGNVRLGANILSTGGTGDATFSGSISGSGGLIKTGSGALSLTGASSYTGATLLNDGTLRLTGQGRLSTSSTLTITQGSFDIATADGARDVGSIAGNGAIRLGANTLTAGSDNTSNTYNGVISGSGGLTKTGSGSLTLTGANTFTGSTTISQGDLIARAQSISAIVVNNAGLILTEDGTATYAGTISGTGTLTKSGSGRIILTGANDYTGTTNIASGVLALGGQGQLHSATNLGISSGTFDISASLGNQEVGSLEGHGSVQLGANTLTMGRNNTNNIYDGAISGSGGLTKTGSGNLTLSGNNSYTGITTINQGSVIAKVNSISERVVNNASLTLNEEISFTTSFISAYSGTISGTGQLIKEGNGIVWLRGRNSYTGGTTVNSGYLIGNTDSLQGNIVNNAALAFYQVDNGTYAGTLSGTGSLLQYGPGVLTLTGNNTHSGGTAFSGTLRVDRDANLGAAHGALVMAGGTLRIGADITTSRNIGLGSAGGTFDTDGHQLAVTGSISGPGNLTKTGAGSLALNGANIYTGATTVNAGRLEVNGAINSNVTVAAGAELGGSGLIAGSLIQNQGRLARGSAIGDIQTQGNVSFEPGSLFTVKADAAGNSDRLVVTAQPSATSGRATLNGGTVEVLAEAGSYRASTRYHIVATERGVDGQFAGVTSNLAFLNPSLSYDTNNVYLTLRRNDASYASVAQTANQRGVAQGLTRLATNATGDATVVAAALDGLSAQQARAAFDSIGGVGRTLMPVSLNVNQRSINQNLVARLGFANSENSLAPATGIAGRGVQLAFDESTRSDAAPVYAQLGVPASTGFRASTADTSNGLWLRGYGGSGRLDGDATAPGAKYNYGGTLLGFDHKFGSATAGVFAGYAEPRYNQDFSASSAKTKTWQVGAYGRYASGAWHVDGVASYAHSDTDTSRVVSVGGLNRLASGAFSGNALSAHIETGYTIKAGGFEVQPLAALSWVRQHQNAYTETGAGALNLVLPDQSQDSLRSSLGVRTLHPFTAAGMQWMFETRAAWSHEFKTARGINARLAGDPAAGVFTVSGPNVPRDSAVLGVGIAAQASKNLRLYADVNTELNGASRAYAVSAGLRYQW